MPVQFEARSDKLSDGTPVVAIAGEIDLFTAPEFKQAVNAAIDSGGDGVVIDLTETTFIDSSSLGVLIGAHRRAESHGASLVVVCDNDAIVKTFRITGLDGIFRLVPSLEAATQAAA
jgi:anti-sigma B factor antagonist